MKLSQTRWSLNKHARKVAPYPASIALELDAETDSDVEENDDEEQEISMLNDTAEANADLSSGLDSRVNLVPFHYASGSSNIVPFKPRTSTSPSDLAAAVPAARSTVVRVSQLPTDQEDIEKWLHDVIDNLLDEQQRPFNSPIHVVPSCYQTTSRWALVEFESGLPASLRDITTGSVYRRFGPHEICFDTHFHGFTQLYPITSGQIEADIIAVTGLGGHAFGSWRSKESGKMWLKDFLSTDFPHCRTLIYGYDSKLGNPSRDTILSFGYSFMAQLEAVRSTQEEKRRPIVFIGHSFGGVIITHCLTEQSERYLELRRVTCGIVFFGTPHRGFDVTDLMALALGDLVTEDNLEVHPQGQLLASIETYAPTLIDRLRHFKNSIQGLTHSIRIVSCYELHATPQVQQDLRTKKWARTGAKKLMVGESVALLGLGDRVEVPISIQKDHSDMTKFDNRSTSPYTDIVPELRKLVLNASKVDQYTMHVLLDETERQSILKWILGDNVNFYQARDRASMQRFKDNCTWFLDGAMYQNWKDGEPAGLWLTGKPGSGKTVLCSAIINSLEDNNESLPFAYFFFDGRSAQQAHQKFLPALRSIIYQLCATGTGFQEPRIPRALFNAYRASSCGLTPPSYSHVRSIFNDAVKLFPKVVIILDALDECTDHDELVSWLADICHGGLNFHILVSSRETVNLSSSFRKIRMEENTRHAIERYIDGQIAEVTWSEALKGETRHTLGVKADGMFYWVDLALNILKERPSESLAREALLEVPSELYGIYEHILRNLKREFRDPVLKILQWLAFAIEDLSLAQVSEVVAIDYNASDGNYLRHDKQWSPESIVPLCGGLVSITFRRQWFSNAVDEVVKLSHFSIKEFLCTRNHDPLDQAISHCEISKACLGYILQLKTTSYDEHKDQKTLARYAARHWYDHAGKSNRKAIDKTWDSLVKLLLLDKAGAFQTSLMLHDPDSFAKEKPSRLYDAAVILGQNPWLLMSLELIKHLILSGADINARGGQYGSALGAAAGGGHRELVELLIEKGADINASGGYFGTPLGVAARGGHLEVVKLLIMKGADINVKGGVDGSPLGAAANQGHRAVVELLIEKGSDINVGGGDYGSPLEAAAGRGHREIIELLIEKGADINVKGGVAGSPLGTAASAGLQEIVELLIEKGADISTGGGDYGSPLGAAAGGGHQAVVKLLIDKDADINAGGGYYGSPLGAAAGEGHLEVVRLLIEKGADINVRGSIDGSPLGTAASGGHREIVELLIEKGADINSRGGEYGSPLGAAANQGHRAVVELLIEKGADINAGGGDYGSPLGAAASGGHREIVQLLIENGADTNVRGGIHGSPLGTAATEGHREIVELLIDKGADIYAEGGYCGSPLGAAANQGHRAVVELLIEKGADINARGGYYGSPLGAAAGGGHREVVELLIEKGADVNARRGIDGSPLGTAASGGHREIVELLIDKGADVNAIGGVDGSPLGTAASGGHREIVELLIEKGADKNAGGGDYGSPLRAAAGGRHREVVELLIEKGADINAGGSDYGSPKVLESLQPM